MPHEKAGSLIPEYRILRCPNLWYETLGSSQSIPNGLLPKRKSLWAVIKTFFAKKLLAKWKISDVSCLSPKGEF